ncbi:hypothetical protein, partial [Halomonas sp. BC04]|uniref:hypothetical protein n=1 Tax=Halomonas sp. BC04 TaxID=1403540 RepID=UPI0003ED74C7
MRILQKTLALTALLFGLVTIFAGIRVLFGASPGYGVFWPLLVYNTVMGVGYSIAGILGWRDIERGKYAAAIIFVLNLLVLGVIAYLYVAGSVVALESLLAMILRTVV